VVVETSWGEKNVSRSDKSGETRRKGKKWERLRTHHPSETPTDASVESELLVVEKVAEDEVAEDLNEGGREGSEGAGANCREGGRRRSGRPRKSRAGRGEGERKGSEGGRKATRGGQRTREVLRQETADPRRLEDSVEADRDGKEDLWRVAREKIQYSLAASET
jgi:hypothetical protein